MSLGLFTGCRCCQRVCTVSSREVDTVAWRTLSHLEVRHHVFVPLFPDQSLLAVAASFPLILINPATAPTGTSLIAETVEYRLIQAWSPVVR
jgi:hypothetical protein